MFQGVIIIFDLRSSTRNLNSFNPFLKTVRNFSWKEVVIDTAKSRCVDLNGQLT